MKLAKKIATLSVASGLAVGAFATATPIFAHGYVDGPKSRALLCKEGVNTNCGSVVYEPQSLEYLKGFPQAGPADGKIASANGQFGGLLDQQSSTRWAKTEITSGPLLMDWTYTAPHSTDGWSYYMTKTGWDPNSPLTRSQFEEIAVIDHDGSKASTNPDHVITVPANRNGYHVILAVWDISDTVNAFYNVIDVNVNGAGEVTEAPNAPKALVASELNSGAVELNWEDSNSDRADVSYTVSRDGAQVGKSNGTSFVDLEATPGATYTYTVTASDTSGNQSATKATVVVQVSQSNDADVTAPTVPANLHTMKVNASGINLMWNESFDASADVTYKVYRDGYLRATTKMTMWQDTSVTAGTSYRYSVSAVDSSGNESASSNVLGVTTPSAPAPAPIDSGNWNSLAAYVKGDTVTFNGVTYRAVQSHTGVGDPNWITALSLWAPVSSPGPVEPAPTPVPNPAPAPAGTWSSTGSYTVGDRVTSGGVDYQAVQSHTGVGDPNWIYAPSLWKKI